MFLSSYSSCLPSSSSSSPLLTFIPLFLFLLFLLIFPFLLLLFFLLLSHRQKTLGPNQATAESA